MASSPFCALIHLMSRRLGLRTPRLSVRICIHRQRVLFHLRAVPGRGWCRIPSACHPGRVHEVLVKVIDELARSVVEGAADRYVVEDREMLDVFAQADATRVRAHGHTKLRG